MKLMEKFRKLLKKMNKSLINTFLSNIIKSYHLSSKLTIFYSFFYLDMPKNINKCFKNIFEITCKYDNYSTLIINTIIQKSYWKFHIEYASDNFCSKTGFYLDQLKKKQIYDLIPDSLQKCFNYNIYQRIKYGHSKLIMKEIIFINNENHTFLVDMVGIVIFNGYKLKLFFKVYPYNFKSKRLNAQNNKINNKNNIEEIYIFVNKNGKIIAISKLFEEYFCLNLNSFKKYNINLK